ncbi:type 1 glutamine amidotransferase domain-containing protein [Paraglaciecola sp.]|uniref:type 1 glutamine amidotransferase domain-containing protein n=1 Tax=Paraglaciecola sp. TaxID=1920173 RepID=UPI003EF2ACBC
MKYPLILLFALFVFTPFITLADQPQKVLIVVSNMLHMGDPEKHEARNNLWEVAPPYHIFLSHSIEVDFVSPQGGPVEFYMDPLGISSYTIKYEGFLDKTRNTLKPKEVNIEDYWAVYTGGGYGPLFDVAGNKQLQSIYSAIYEAGGIIGIGGHGAGAIVDVKLSSGVFLVRNKRIAAFPNSTEKSKSWAKQGTLLPFLIEDRLNENGAIALNKKTLKDKHQVVVDQRVVSTMFLPSAALVAKEMILLHE